MERKIEKNEINLKNIYSSVKMISLLNDRNTYTIFDESYRNKTINPLNKICDDLNEMIKDW